MEGTVSEYKNGVRAYKKLQQRLAELSQLTDLEERYGDISRSSLRALEFIPFYGLLQLANNARGSVCNTLEGSMLTASSRYWVKAFVRTCNEKLNFDYECLGVSLEKRVQKAFLNEQIRSQVETIIAQARAEFETVLNALLAEREEVRHWVDKALHYKRVGE